MRVRGVDNRERRHWFYDSRLMVFDFCLTAFVAIF
jgi:hypothetical protein